jgi:hypothetical protein
MLQTVKDSLGHEIYLTDERWDHICEEHLEMQGYEDQVLETIQKGGRFQDSLRPDVFLYYRDFEGLPAANTTMVVAVRFGFTPGGAENNFILTAYQIFRHRR